MEFPGGIDSCLCAALAKPVCDGLGIPLIGRSLPISTNAPEEIERAKLTGEAFCTNFEQINLTSYFDIISDDLIPGIKHDTPETEAKEYKIRDGNIKARLRMIYLYDLASKNHGMVLSTDNYTEFLLGFWTLHGDVGDYGMIQNLYKTEVYDMAEYLMHTFPCYSSKIDFPGLQNIEKSSTEEYWTLKTTIEALATDGLGVTSLGDLGQILPDFKGTSRDGYKEVDKILHIFLLLKNEALMTPKVIKAIDKMITHPVIQRHLNTGFKRKNPVNIDRNLIEK